MRSAEAAFRASTGRSRGTWLNSCSFGLSTKTNKLGACFTFIKMPKSESAHLFLEALSKKYGTIRPVLDRLRRAMTSLDQAKLSGLEEDMRTATLFDDAVLEHVRAIVEAIVNEHAERQRELASRLRRDARVKTAFRRLTKTRAEVID
jgi:hypothetical protein